MRIEEIVDNAKWGILDAQYILAFCFEYGFGVERSAEMAEFWCRKASEEGYPPAQFELSRLIIENNEADIDESIGWLRRSARGGFAPALFLLSVYFEGGVGGAVDMEEAFRLSVSAARKGYLPAIKRTASMLEQGKGVSADPKMAFDWFKRGAELDDADSIAAVGRMYAEGFAVARDEDQALLWLTRGAEAGSPWACLRLSAALRFGELGQSIDSSRADELDARAMELIERKRVAAGQK